MVYLINFLLGVAGGAVTIILKEYVNNSKNTKLGKWVSQVALLNEINNNHEELTFIRNNNRTLLEDVLKGNNHNFEENLFKLNNWEDTKTDIVKHNPALGKELFKLYSCYEELKRAQNTKYINKYMFDDYKVKYKKVISLLED